jgi:hypothetical protein
LEQLVDVLTVPFLTLAQELLIDSPVCETCHS